MHFYVKFQDMVNEIDKDAKGIIKFPEYLYMMAKKYSDDNAEDEIRETSYLICRTETDLLADKNWDR